MRCSVRAMARVRPLRAEGEVEVTSLYLDLLEAPAEGERPHVVSNMVVSADGRATLHGTADIGSRTDRALLKQLRSLADAVMVGAGTLRASDFVPRIGDEEAVERRQRAGKAAQPLAVVVSHQGALPLEARFFNLPQERIVAVAGTASREAREALVRRGAMVRTFGEQAVDLAALVRWLRAERGVKVLLSEGGPHVIARLFGERLLDEVFLTQSWRVTGEAEALRWVEGTVLEGVRLEPRESYDGDGERYYRFRVQYQ